MISILRMKSPPLFTMCCLGVLSSAQGQDSNEITGKIDNGSKREAVSAPLPSYRILSTVTKARKNREITFRQVEAPEIQEPLRWSSSEQPIEADKPNHSFVVSSVTYPGRGTKVRWWSTNGGEKVFYECWSNIDWKNLGGFHRYGSDSQSFIFMLFHQVAAELEEGETSPVLPNLANGARYMVTAGDETNDAAMDFIEGLHEIYDLRKQDLETAAVQRQVAAENLRIEKMRDAQAPVVKKLEVNFWPLTPEQKAR